MRARTLAALRTSSLLVLLAAGARAQVVVSQVYGGGGLSGSTYAHDFVELHNVSAAPVDLSTWSLQATSGNGVMWSRMDLASIVPAGGYLLVQLGGSGSGVPVPTPDEVGTLALALADGKVALVSNQSTLPPRPCVRAGELGVVDFVGYGAANCYEGDGPTSSLGKTTAALRPTASCLDLDHNALDFVVAAPSPRSSATPLDACVAFGACCSGASCSIESAGSCAGSYAGDFTHCPDPLYAAPAPSASAFEDISTTGTPLVFANQDDAAAAATLPWSFPFFGAQRQALSIGINGFVAFAPGSLATAAGNTALPFASAPNDIVCALWDDLYLRNASAAVYVEARSSPERFVVQWDHVSTLASGATTPDDFTFQLVLFASGEIEARYATMASSPSTLSSATVGLENQAGDRASFLSAALVLPGSVAFRWDPPSSPLCAPPLNDVCANALELGLGATLSASTALATHGGASSCDATGRDVWFTLTTPGAGDLAIETCGSTIDTALALFDGCGGVELACNDDCSGTPCSAADACLSYSAPSAGTYWLRVSDKALAAGDFQVRWTFRRQNDDCASAIAVALGSTTPGSFALANAEDPSVPACVGPLPGRAQNFALTNGVWYVLNSPTTQTVTVDTLASSIDTKLWVYDGSAGCGALACVTANDDILGSPFPSKAAFVALAGVDYYVLVGPYTNGRVGTDFVLTVSADATPAGDDCASPIVLSSATGSIAATTVGATGATNSDEAANPACQDPLTGNAVFDVWFEFTAPCSETFTFETCGSFDTLLSVHSACPTASTNEQIAGACNDDGAPGCAPGSSVSFAAVASTSYLIRVAGVDGAAAGASFSLTWSAPDSDGDGVIDCLDGCPSDPNKLDPGVCGCGVSDVDTDGDLVADCLDACPTDPLKTDPGQCGCGVVDVDTDGDLVADCVDGCPNDPNKSAPGQCGCGAADIDTDGDLVADCVDGCPNDPNKTAPGICGCGVDDADTDGDLVADCLDGCPTDPAKTDPGVCGCGSPDVDSDGDGALDCNDGCPLDPLKLTPGVCGCGTPDVDSDGDGTFDCFDACPNDPDKVAPGVCGCGTPDVDSDGDLVEDCIDGCPNDANKLDPGQCGCGVVDVDTDGDLVADCVDGCPNDFDKVAPGQCGCGVPDTDTDGDLVADCVDGCPNDPNKTAPGVCGCGVDDVDTDGDLTPDCNDGCPLDPLKLVPGVCGCGAPDVDSDGDSVFDCDDNCPNDPNPLQLDCDVDGAGDVCEIASGSATDVNLNGIPDNCEAGSFFNYCTAGTTTNGCTPMMGASGVFSATASSGFVLTTTGVEGQKQGILFYGVTGVAAAPWAPGSTSFKCVKSPVQRTGNQNSGGTLNLCDGVMSKDLLAYFATHPNALGVPPAAGVVFNFQAWFRDPAAPSTTNLSDALQATCGP